MIYDKAQAVGAGSEKFAAFVTYFDDCAVVQIYAKPTPREIDFSKEVAEYETARRGAFGSAKREVRKLEKEG